MSFIKTPVKGMRDCLPADVQLREHVMSMIRQTYAAYGFNEIETPAIEHIENLSNKQGGENEKLIFKILKRGRDLEKVKQAGTDDYADSGLRYDLTVPLARYYANNANSLPAPFKSLQIGSVWRADKPQKGRFRQFTQCDIDILGESSIMAEIELIAATANMISRIFSEVGITRFTVHVSDRNILKAMAKYAGFAESEYDNVFVTLDKLDKIGIQGVTDELAKSGYDAACIEKYVAIFRDLQQGVSCGEFCSFLTGEYLDAKVIEGLDTILRCARAMTPEDVSIVFDPTLVRGMSYYTGTIFECTIDGYGFAIAGGGRYDKMIGKYSGSDVCACGFSIGFERIITILQDHLSAREADQPRKVAILVENGAPAEVLIDAFTKAQELRAEGVIVAVQTMKKNMNFQIRQLEADGYREVQKIYRSVK